MADCSVSSAPGQTTTTSADPESPSAKELQQQVSEVRLFFFYFYYFYFYLSLFLLPFCVCSQKTFIPFITISLPSPCDPERYPLFLFIFLLAHYFPFPFVLFQTRELHLIPGNEMEGTGTQSFNSIVIIPLYNRFLFSFFLSFN
jgi:hypothetical protein